MAMQKVAISNKVQTVQTSSFKQSKNSTNIQFQTKYIQQNSTKDQSHCKERLASQYLDSSVQHQRTPQQSRWSLSITSSLSQSGQVPSNKIHMRFTWAAKSYRTTVSRNCFASWFIRAVRVWRSRKALDVNIFFIYLILQYEMVVLGCCRKLAPLFARKSTCSLPQWPGTHWRTVYFPFKVRVLKNSWHWRISGVINLSRRQWLWGA